MIQMILIRDQFTEQATLGRLLWNGDPFGFVLEDTDRGLLAEMPLEEIARRKVAAETAIPTSPEAGYEVHWTLSPSRQEYTPRLKAVPGFRGILLHSGNVSAHTAGCLLPGLEREADKVLKSKLACKWLYPRIAAAREKKESVVLYLRRDVGAWAARCAVRPELRFDG